MKKIVFLFTLLLGVYSLQAQQIQWANKLIKFSSDLGGKQNGIKRILGKPDAFPQAGSSPNAWLPKKALDEREIVIVGFDKPQTVQQVAIFENTNSGCVTKIMVSTDEKNFETAWYRKPDYKTPLYKSTLSIDRSYYFKRKRRKVEEAPSVINPGIENAIFDTSFSNVIAVKVEFAFALLPGEKQIDAIGISDSNKPIEAEINTLTQFENLMEVQTIDLGTTNFSTVSLSKDGDKMFLTSLLNEKEMIYTVSKKVDKWDIPVLNMDLSDNSQYNYIQSSGSDFILKGGANYEKANNETGYYFYSNSDFKKQSPLLIKAFSNYGEYSDACISNDKKTIILSVESDFSQGGNDLYVTNLKEDGTYSILQNLGKVINSAADELNPHLLSDNKTLLFSSDGFSSFGNNDLFVSYRLDDTWKNWSEPINLGSKINGPGYDGSPFYDENSETLYFNKSIDEKSTISFIKIARLDLIKKD